MPDTTTTNRIETKLSKTTILSNNHESSVQDQELILNLVEAANYINNGSRLGASDAETDIIQSLTYIKTLAEISNQMLTGMMTIIETNVQTCIKIGLNFITSGQEEAARSYFEVALTFVARDTKACFNVGLDLTNLGQEETAKIFYKQVTKYKAYDANTYFQKGMSLYFLEQYDEAIKHYNQAIALDPNYTDSYTHKGQALAALGSYEDAIKLYDYAINLDAMDPEALESKSLVLAKLGRTEEAIECSKLADSIELSSRIDNKWDCGHYSTYLLGVEHMNI